MWWGWRRPEPGDGLIALLLMLVVYIALLPVRGIAGLMSSDEGEKTKGATMHWMQGIRLRQRITATRLLKFARTIAKHG